MAWAAASVGLNEKQKTLQREPTSIDRLRYLSHSGEDADDARDDVTRCTINSKVSIKRQYVNHLP